MTRATLLALAARVEAARGADRALDAEIFCAEPANTAFRRDPDDWGGYFCTLDWRRKEAPAFTSSLDAAASLVPEGCSWHVQSNPNVNACWANVWNVSPHVWGGGMCKAATPALALTAAALRALAEEAGDGE